MSLIDLMQHCRMMGDRWFFAGGQWALNSSFLTWSPIAENRLFNFVSLFFLNGMLVMITFFDLAYYFSHSRVTFKIFNFLLQVYRIVFILPTKLPIFFSNSCTNSLMLSTLSDITCSYLLNSFFNRASMYVLLVHPHPYLIHTFLILKLYF